MKKPIIGIVSRFSDDFQRIELDEEYRMAIAKAGALPLMIIPNNYKKYNAITKNKLTKDEVDELKRVVNLCDGILMPGGSKWFDYDEIICKYAIDKNIPILGICLGMQILGSIDNFNKIDSDRTIKNETNINHNQQEKYVHKISIESNYLCKLLNTSEIYVNSRHDYHIIEKKYFKILAYSEDGLIEAIKIPKKLFAIGVQWHPESMVEYDDKMFKIFKWFISSATSYMLIKKKNNKI